MASTAQILRALMSGSRLDLVIALNPKAADVIPRGPLHSVIVTRYAADEVALNPQPLPPAEMVVGVRLMHKMAEAAIGGGGFSGQFLEDLDDWCGTGWPRRWPKPRPVSEPAHWQNEQVFLGALLAAAEISAHYDDPDVVGVFDKAIEMLGEAAVGKAR